MSIDAVWVDAVSRVIDSQSCERPGAEWFCAGELAEHYGWTDHKARNYLTRNTAKFERCKRGSRTWWRVIDP